MRARRLILSVLGAMLGVLVLASAPALALKEYVPGGSFGSIGSGNGQFEEPTGIAVNDSTEPLSEPAAGDVYVIDSGNQRVERFSSTGTYISQFDGGETPAKNFEFLSYPSRSSQVIAIDNSGNLLDPSAGDVYVEDTGNGVIDKFSATGEYKEQLTGTCAEPGICPGKAVPFGGLYGLAVDPSGNLWVSYEEELSSGKHESVGEFSDTGGFVKAFNAHIIANPSALGADSSSVYAVTNLDRVQKFNSATGIEVAQFGQNNVTALGIDPTTHNVLVDEGSTIVLYGPFGEPYSNPLQTFPSEGVERSDGIAVNGAGTAYVSQRETGNVKLFNYLTLPVVRTGLGSQVSETSETLHGVVNPEGEATTECRFEYGTKASYGQSAPCEQTPTGNGPVAVSAVVSGLEPVTAYHFRLADADANGSKHGEDETFHTIVAPVLEGESVTAVGSVSATVSAQVKAGGTSTSYRVEYGPSIPYESSTVDVSVGAPLREAVGVQARLTGLEPGVEYHFRFVAKNELGSVVGGDLAFATTASTGGSALTLPDDRAYELVSAVGDGDVYIPEVPGPNEEGGGEDIKAFQPFRASSNGNAVTYLGDPPSVGGIGSVGPGKGNQWLSTRTAGGWAARDITPPGIFTTFRGFTSDLSVGFVRSQNQPPLTADAPPTCWVLYAHNNSDDTNRALFTTTETPGKCGFPELAGASADNSHVIFQDAAALVPPARKPEEEEGQFNLYDSVGGQAHLVNVLPDGETDPNARFGGSASTFESDYSNVISADGSRIFWTDLVTDDLYVRENDSTTVQVDASQGPDSGGGGKFWTASGDGSVVYFTDENRLTNDSTAAPGEPDLYTYEVGPEIGGAGKLTDLTVGEQAGEHANVQGVVGVNETGAIGSYIYFVADGRLTTGQNAEGKEPTAGEPNLYLRHNGETTFLTTLSVGDDHLQGVNGAGIGGDWQADLGDRTAEVTPDGHSVVFMSRLNLTGYDNEGSPELYVYDADSKQVACASCNPSGTPPSGGGTAVPFSWDSEFGTTFMRRFISADGSRVFFETQDPLVSRDTNGKFDVYEWERSGAGSCPAAGRGCVYLLSGGTGSDGSYLVDAGADGSDVFFTTRDQLTAQDRNGTVKLYDARVDGGFPEFSLACTGTGCQGVPPAPPIFATPSSVTFSGVGNFEPPKAATKSKPKSKPVKCKRGFVKKHGKCAKKRAKKASKRSKRRGK